jgi:two-component system phosphate regulon sensor histidine kinase PhoR
MHDQHTNHDTIEKLHTQVTECSDFLSLMIHQLRTPLTANKWALHMFQSGDFGTLSDEGKIILEKIIQNNNQAIELLHDIHQANHVATWKLEMNLRPTHLSPMMVSLVESFQSEASGNNITMINHVPENVPLIIGDEKQLKMIFQNILENAIKYNRPHGSITIESHIHHDQLVISIHDSGIGIPLDSQKQLFTKFFRAPNVLETHQGTGLGLFVVKQIIDAHHGTIWIESQESIGTTVFVGLPLAK